MNVRRRFAILIAVCLMTPAAPALAQSYPWETFIDEPTISDSVCSVINTANAELVLLQATDELVVVSGPDNLLNGAVVTVNSDVLFNGQPFGFLAFDVDGDNFRSLWWLSSTGRVIELDESSGVPIPVVSDCSPDEFERVPCDACDFWDDQSICQAPPDRPTIPIDFCGINSAASMGLLMMGLTLMRRSRRANLVLPPPIHSPHS